MRWSAVYLLAGASAVLPGCCCSGPPAPIFLGPEDTGPDAAIVFLFPDAGRDASPVDASTCGALSPCTATSCAIGTCAHRPPSSIGSLLGIDPGAPSDPLHPGYAATVPAPDPALDATVQLFAPSLCVAACDLTTASTCGPCAACSHTLTQMPLLATLGGASLVSGSGTLSDGLCRPRCTFDPDGPGDCPAGSTCDELEGVCIEACQSDLECNTNVGVTYEGEVVALVETEHARACDLGTGRCESSAAASLGDACGSDAECGAGDLCLDGACASPGCTASACGDGRGACVDFALATTFCVLGCHDASDCAPGLACVAFGASIGGFSGMCVGACTQHADCRASEICAPDAPLDPPWHADRSPRCVPSCSPVDARGVAAGCADGEFCRAVEAGLGRCAPLGGFCDLATPSLDAHSDACGSGQICDALLAGPVGRSVADGHCVDPCTSDAECATLPSFVCVTSGPLAGLCRAPCSASGACNPGQTCDATLGYCVESP